MVAIRFHSRNYQNVYDLNNDMILSLIGSKGFVDNDISIGPIKRDESTELYYYDLLLGESGGTNLMIEFDGIKIEKLVEER